MIRRCLALAAVVLSTGAIGHEGHDHGPEPAAAVASSGGPRFALASDAFELVGAIDGRRVTLWLDRAADTAPVSGATLELEIGGRVVPLRADRDVYVGELAAPLAPGRVPVSATVIAADASDLLAGELVVDAPVDTRAASSARGSASPFSWSTGPRSTIAIAAMSALLAGAVGWFAARRRPRAGRG